MTSAGKLLQDRYLIQKQIGAGGMGTVYVATDERFGSTVAIKETLFTDPNLRRAFEREAQLLNSLRHSALPRVSDHFTEGNGAFIVMEYIAGEDLSAMVERGGAFAVADVLRWADDLLDALDYLHNQKFPVVHRDIKPQNLKLTQRGEIILLDFGLAKGSASELSQISVIKSIFGYSRSYAALEQIQGTGTDPRSDLYSLAATLYHLLTGNLPVDALTRATAVLNGNNDPLPLAHTLNAKIPIGVSQILSSAMALNANLRPATAAKMRFDLNEAKENPAFYDGATLLSDSPGVFSQNTQLMNADGKTNKVEVPLTTDGLTVNAQPNLTAPQPFATEIDKSRAAGNSPHPSFALSRSRSLLTPMKIAAAILLFGTGVFAIFLSGSLNLSKGDGKATDSIQKSSLISEPAANTTVEAANASVSTVDNTGATSVDQTNAGNKPAVTVQIKPSEQARTNQSKSSKNPSAAPKPEADATDEDAADLKNLDKEIDDAITESKDKGNGFDSIPPEIRSTDPRNPVDKEKLKIFIKKRQKEIIRQVEEANRVRGIKGLPPLPPSAKPPQIKIRSHPETEVNSNN